MPTILTTVNTGQVCVDLILTCEGKGRVAVKAIENISLKCKSWQNCSPRIKFGVRREEFPGLKSIKLKKVDGRCQVKAYVVNTNGIPSFGLDMAVVRQISRVNDKLCRSLSGERRCDEDE